MTTANGRASATATEENESNSDRTNELRNRHVSHAPSPESHSHAQDQESQSSSMKRKASNSFSLRSNSTSIHDRANDLRSTTSDLLSPRATGGTVEEQVETSLWHSVPLLLALLPAIGGLAFKQGNVLFTDFTLLILAAIYLQWFLVTPWTWYHSARSVYLTQSLDPDHAVDDTIEEEEDDEEEEGSDDKQKKTASGKVKKPSKDSSTPKTKEGKRNKAAVKELQVQEVLALLLCFIGPVIGAYMLHIIRGYLTSEVGHQLVSDLHLSLFVLGAELRPLRHAMKLMHARTLFLQRTVQQDQQQSTEKIDLDVVRELSKRLDELEATSTSDAAKSSLDQAALTPQDNSEQFRKAHSTLQTQIDALNRAVRRYEKRATAQTMQTEARLQELEVRLREALSLAAVAAAYSQKPGIAAKLLEYTAALLLLPLKFLRAATVYPLTALNEVTMIIMTRFGLRHDKNEARQYTIVKSRDGSLARKQKA